MKDISFWAQKELVLIKRKSELQRSLAGLEAEAAALMLDNEGEEEIVASNPRGSLDMVSRVEAEIRALDGAIRGSRARRLDAIRAARAAEVVARRKGAADKAREISSLEAKTSKLLEQLAELQGCDYVPAGTARTSTLRAEIGELNRAASDLEQGDVPATGAVDLGDGVPSADEVALAVAVFPAAAVASARSSFT